MYETKYALGRKHYRHATDYDFIAELAHEFAGEKDVVSYAPLKLGIHYASRQEADDTLALQPEWVRRDTVVVEFLDFLSHCIIKQQND